MHRHLIAGAFACFGSSLFGQTTDTANQTTGTLNKVQSTLQDGVQKGQDSVNRTIQQSPLTPTLRDGQNQPFLDNQTQAGGSLGPTGSTRIQNNSNLQNNLNRQPGQSSLNSSTQIQGQGTLNQQLRGNRIQDPNSQNGNAYQLNGNGGFQAQSPQIQGQTTQNGQPLQQSWSSHNSGRVYMLRVDACGREFICVDGRPVYFDKVNSLSMQANAATQNQYRSGNGSFDSQNGRNAEAPPAADNQNADQPIIDQQGSLAVPRSSRDGRSEPTQDRSKSRDINNDELNPNTLDDARNNNSSELNKRENDNVVQADVDANAEVNQQGESTKDLIQPKR
ncbi:hypothetical protein SH449x_000218 [Pirellulaceae bacterium SH449]